MIDKIQGTEIRMRLTLKGLDIVTFDRCTISKATFYTQNDKSKTYVLHQEQFVRYDADSFDCIVDSGELNLGVIWVEVEVYVPDPVGADGNRFEIYRKQTDVNIIP